MSPKRIQTIQTGIKPAFKKQLRAPRKAWLNQAESACHGLTPFGRHRSRSDIEEWDRVWVLSVGRCHGVRAYLPAWLLAVRRFANQWEASKSIIITITIAFMCRRHGIDAGAVDASMNHHHHHHRHHVTSKNV